VETPTLRIFISSPGHGKEERRKAQQVVDQLQRWYGDAVVLKPVLWEDLRLEIDASFQDGIDVILSGDKGIDIAVVILWSRIGTPVTIGDRHYNSGGTRALPPDGGAQPGAAQDRAQSGLADRHQEVMGDVLRLSGGGGTGFPFLFHEVPRHVLAEPKESDDQALPLRRVDLGPSQPHFDGQGEG
jgi:hypothetical protein